MKTKKKNRFFTFIASCIPGAGQMYMGFMKMGVSMMMVFVLTIIIAIWINQGVLASICVVEWFYSFFQANHLASLSDEEFSQVKDEYLFGLDALPGAKIFVGKYNKLIAYALIFVGGCFLWDTLANLLSWILPEQLRFIYRSMRYVGNYAPSILIGCGIIFLGVKMLGGKKVETFSGGQEVPMVDTKADMNTDSNEKPE